MYLLPVQEQRPICKNCSDPTASPFSIAHVGRIGTIISQDGSSCPSIRFKVGGQAWLLKKAEADMGTSRATRFHMDSSTNPGSLGIGEWQQQGAMEKEQDGQGSYRKPQGNRELLR